MLFLKLSSRIPESLHTLDITMPQLKIMSILYVQGYMRMSDIASELNVTLPTATSFIDNKELLQEMDNDKLKMLADVLESLKEATNSPANQLHPQAAGSGKGRNSRN